MGRLEWIKPSAEHGGAWTEYRYENASGSDVAKVWAYQRQNGSETNSVITFDARVNAGVPTGTLISNQGRVTANELSSEPTDADGLPSNGYQPTVIVVGDAQLLSVTKEVAIAGGGAATAGGQLAYTIRVTNIGTLPATRVMVTDDLSPPLGDQVAYIAGSGTLNGSAAGVTYASSTLTADYAGQYGDLQPGNSAVVRFRVQIAPALAIGTTITNTGIVRWNDPAQTASASASLDVGGTPGEVATLRWTRMSAPGPRVPP